jgi:hypothetical protein
MTHKEYNGWTNYETWLVKLWMDNDEGTQDYWREQAREALETAKDTTIAVTPSFTVYERAVLSFSNELRDGHENSVADMLENAKQSNGFMADLINAALSEVNWHEIATAVIDAELQTA